MCCRGRLKALPSRKEEHGLGPMHYVLISISLICLENPLFQKALTSQNYLQKEGNRCFLLLGHTFPSSPIFLLPPHTLTVLERFGFRPHFSGHLCLLESFPWGWLGDMGCCRHFWKTVTNPPILLPLGFIWGFMKTRVSCTPSLHSSN